MEILHLCTKKETTGLLFGLDKFMNSREEKNSELDIGMLRYGKGVHTLEPGIIISEFLFNDFKPVETLSEKQLIWITDSLKEIISKDSVTKITKKQPLVLYYLEDGKDLIFMSTNIVVRNYNCEPSKFIPESPAMKKIAKLHNGKVIQEYTDKDSISNIKSGTYWRLSDKIPFAVPDTVRKQYIRSDVISIVFEEFFTIESLKEYRPVSIKIIYPSFSIRFYYGILDVTRRD